MERLQLGKRCGKIAGVAGAAPLPEREEADLGLRAGWTVKADVRAEGLLGQLAYDKQPGGPEPDALAAGPPGGGVQP